MSNKTTTIEFYQKENISSSLSLALGKKEAKTFIRSIIALTLKNPVLKECSNLELMNCCMQAADLNLPVSNNLGQVWIIPRKVNNKITPVFQIGYKGLIQLAIRSGFYKTLTTAIIREGEIEMCRITSKLTVIGEYPENKKVGYLTYLELQNGFSHFEYMTVEECHAHGQRYSPSYNKPKGIWKTNPDEMCLKTTVLKAFKYGVITPEMSTAIENDADTDAKGFTEARETDEPTTDQTYNAVVMEDEKDKPRDLKDL